MGEQIFCFWLRQLANSFYLVTCLAVVNLGAAVIDYCGEKNIKRKQLMLHQRETCSQDTAKWYYAALMLGLAPTVDI